MAILRNRTQKNFTIVSNGILQEKSLTLKERGMLATLLSLPNDWDFTVFGLMKIIPEKKDAINSAINSLEKKGYIKRYRLRDEQGHMKATVIEVFDTPQSDDGTNSDNNEDDGDTEDDTRMDKPEENVPELGNPASENPASDNPTLGNPTLGEPTLEEPMLENQPQYNTKANQVLNESITNENKRLNKSISNSINHSIDPDEYIWEEYTPEVKQEMIERLKKNIGYDSRKRREREADFELFDALTQVVIDFINLDYKGFYVEIAKQKKPYNEVIESFMKLKFEHINCARNKIKYVGMDKIFDFKAYCLPTLYRLSLVPASACKEKEKSGFNNIMEHDYDFEELEQLMMRGRRS